MKSEGVKDVVKWLEEKCKQAKLEVERAKKAKNSFFIDNEYGNYLDTEYFIAEAKLNQLVSIKISTEKYMKKLQHEERGE